MAMIDVISGSRVISGMVRGVGVETVATNVYPVDNQERFEECHELVINTWTTPGPFRHQNFEELKENYHIVCGTPGTMLDKLKYLHDRLGMDHLIMYGQESRMSHEATMSNIGFFGKEMLPVIRDW